MTEDLKRIQHQKAFQLQFFFETESCSLPLHEYGFLLLIKKANFDCAAAEMHCQSNPIAIVRQHL